MTAPLITAKNVTVIREKRVILDNVSLEINAGDILTVIGPNGAGKTTLLKSLMGVEAPDEGVIKRRPGLAIGYVPQRVHADSMIPMTARRFLRLSRTVSDPDWMQSVIDETGIRFALDTELHRLSGGELQRVFLARSLVHRPDLLILDEPVHNLDIAGRLAFYRQIERLHHLWSVAVLMVSHDLHMVMASTTRVICLFHHICCSGAPHLVAKDPEFVSLFGAEMARLVSVYRHHHDHDHDHSHGH